MAQEKLCTKDPTTCAFGTLAQLMPEVLTVVRKQNEMIIELYEFKSVKSKADNTAIYYLNERYKYIVDKLNTWSKRHVKEAAKCPQHPKH